MREQRVQRAIRLARSAEPDRALLRVRLRQQSLSWPTTASASMFEFLLAIGISITLMGVTILLHLGALIALRRLLPRLGARRALTMAIGVFALFLAHLVEILLFSLVYLLFRAIGGLFPESALTHFTDVFAFSATAYSTLGMTSVEPQGIAKIVAPLQGLTGFMMITWSATFTYSAMEVWEQEEDEPEEENQECEPDPH